MSSIPREALKASASKPGAMVVAELEAQCLRARRHFLRVVDVARADLVDDFGGAVAQHALGADVEQLDDAFLVGGDDREIGAGQDRVLQRAGLEQCVLAAHVGAAVHLAGIGGKDGRIRCF